MPDLDAPSHAGRNLLVLLVLLVLAVFAFALLRGGAPAIQAQWPAAVGRDARLPIAIQDGMGLRSARVFYRQGGRELPVAAFSRAGRNWFFGGGERSLRLTPAIGTRGVAGLKDGPATLVVSATAANLRGAAAEVEKRVMIRSRPPLIEPISTQQYVRQGGAELVTYRVLLPGQAATQTPNPAASQASDQAPGDSPAAGLAAVTSGVEMAGDFFPGHPVPGAGPGVMFCLFAFPYNAPAGSVPRLLARDDAGNQTIANFPVELIPEKFRTRVFAIDDAFIQRVVAPIIAQTPSLPDPPTPLAQFLEVNRDLRRTDAAALLAAAKQSEDQFLWRGAFLPLAHATVEADYADHRLYKYDGKVVDQEDHLGYDLAAVRHTPVLAANSGRVLWAHYFGIYGNAILIDHGYGLMSLYAHLNDFVAHPGETVQRGQLIAHSDSTGLAGGDHLHFSMLLDGVQVNPLEWWDPNWVRNRIENKLQQAGMSNAP